MGTAAATRIESRNCSASLRVKFTGFAAGEIDNKIPSSGRITGKPETIDMGDKRATLGSEAEITLLAVKLPESRLIVHVENSELPANRPEFAGTAPQRVNCPVGTNSGCPGYVVDKPFQCLRVMKYVDLRIGRVVSDRFQENRAALPAVRQDPPPEVDTLARPPDCSPRAAHKREVQEDDRVRGTKPSLHNVQLSQITIHDPSLFRDKQLLGGCPIVPKCSDEAGSPENLIQFHHGKADDLAQELRQSRFA